MFHHNFLMELYILVILAHMLAYSTALIKNKQLLNIVAYLCFVTVQLLQNHLHKSSSSYLYNLVGRDGFEPSYSNENRFTVCRL